ncbi:DUF3019 domain-containing protein [Shewanella sp. JM162201]|uniref:DUF3019 domain-containing protein n=1 Tax=Shewanella jiangmenensis TaxID=2837387 RepID=A0ABS5V2Y8_9GAMM|nr:DUF3019 domain-containing protein [Shewanella jiangmenensis]MBT1444290.1 DUF3019 domain-containing protein [Shewanella jiangmenensis]
MKIILSLILLCIGLVPGSMPKAAELKVTPKACATSADNLPCRFDVSVTYAGEREQDLCLWLKHETGPRRCYTGLKELSEQLSLALEQDTQVEIRDMESRVLLSADLSVALFQPPVKRKRRGLNWDLL